MTLYDDARQTTKSTLARMPASIRPDMQRFLELKQLKSQPTSVRNVAQMLGRFHDFFGDRDPLSLSPDDLRRFSMHLTQTYAVRTAYFTCLTVKPYLSWLGGKRISDEASDALTTRPPSKLPDASHLIHSNEWEALVAMCHTFHDGLSPIRHLRSYAALMTLRYCGMRVSELCALDVASVHLDDQGATLTIPNHAEGLKTGARKVYVVEPVSALRAWLSIHPDARPDSPLFTSLRSLQGRTRLRPDNFATHVHLLAERAGVNAGRLKPVTPHDFRHTRATELAKANLSESKLRNFFGWAPGSHMPSYYVYLACGDLRDDLLQLAATTAPSATKTCPTCAEDINAAALKCRYCGEVVKVSV